jgi:PadR family transcriptional regulator, regulatory protein PadR
MALVNGPKHGYEISKHIEEKSNGFFKMPFGTLYPILHNLEKLKYVTVLIEEADSLRPKKVYSLTKLGKTQATADIEQFQLFYKATNKLVST